MGFPNLKDIFTGFIITRIVDRLDDVAESQLSKSEVARLMCQKINEGGTIQGVIQVYVDHSKDPAIVRADLLTDSFFLALHDAVEAFRDRPLLEIIDRYLSGIPFPDFDGKPENDVPLNVWIRDVVEDVATGKQGDEPN